MSLNGLGVVAIWHDLLPQAKADFYEWHNREHMPERVGIPGFRRGRRYIALSGSPEYFNLYEANSPDVLSGQDYLQRLNAPTPWTRQVVASFRGVARSICYVLFSDGVGQGGVMLTLRFDVNVQAENAVTDLLKQILLPPLVDMQSITGVHMCRADEEGSRVETAEKKARNEGTLVPRWVLLIEGVNAIAVENAAAQLRAALAEQTNPGDINDLNQATYLFEYQRGKLPAG